MLLSFVLVVVAAAVFLGLIWGVVGYVFGLIFSGLVCGALGRLAVPGPNPMSIGATILVGIGGSFLGGLVGWLVFRSNAGWILSVAGAALIVWLLQRNRPRVG